MELAFQRFPEVILADSTPKMNGQGMVLYTLLCMDGNEKPRLQQYILNPVQRWDIPTQDGWDR